jgi:uncharacterized Zn-binding protein involved in type VI secretion
MILNTRPVAALGDKVICLGPCSPGNIILTFQFRVFVNMRPVSCLGDMSTNCCVGAPGCWCPRNIITGSYRTYIGMRPVARLGDLATQGIIVTGSPNTFVG